MALGDNYATLDELKAYLSLSGQSAVDDQLMDALQSSSREIERHCGRQFNRVETATAREYVVSSCNQVLVDDFWSTTGFALVTDGAFDGTYSTTWTTSQYRTFPLNGVVDGQAGWPQWKLKRTVQSGITFPYSYYGQPTVKVTALWGWAAVPAPVKQACLILAAMAFQLKDAPLGVAGMGEFGVIRVRNSRMAEDKLNDYCRNKVICK